MEKAHSRIKWENYPSIATPLNEANLNKMDIALDEVDNRVLGLDTAKLDKATANTMIKDISFEEKTGIFTITLLNGTTKTIDTKLEKIATNFSYDYETQKLKLTLADGTEQEIDLSSLLSQYEFTDSDTIILSVDSDGKVTAIVKDGSITEDKLQPNFLADVKVEVAKAKSSSDSAYENATIARESAVDAKTYRDEAEQFRNEVEAASGVTIATTEKAGLVKPDGDTIRVDPDGTIHADRGTTSYTDLENKPKINDVVLEGEKTLEELGIASKEALEKTDSKVNIIIESAELRFKENASGENIHLDDSADSKLVEFGLYGKATQNGIPTPENPVEIGVAGESYNLIPYPYEITTKTVNGITWTDLGDGRIMANGTATETSSFDKFLGNQTEGLREKLQSYGEVILTGCPSGGGSSTFRLFVWGAYNKGEYSANDYGSGATFTFDNDDKGFGFSTQIMKGVKVENLVFKPMLRKASVKNDRYMPYGKGSVEVKSVGKNLYDRNKDGNRTNVGVTATITDGIMTLNGTATSSGALPGTTENINILDAKVGDVFTLSAKIIDGTATMASNTTIAYVSFRGVSGSEITKVNANIMPNGNSIDKNSKLSSITFTIAENMFAEDGTLRIFVQTYIRSGDVCNNLKLAVQIEKGDIATEFEPYKETFATIPTINGLAGIPVDSGGNYTDKNGQQWICDEIIKYSDGSGEYIQRIGKVIFDGSETWGKSSNAGNNTYYSPVLDALKDSNTNVVHGMISDRFTERPYTNHGDVACCSYGNPNNAKAELRISVGLNSELNTIELFKAWLVNNPTTVYYILAEPITAPLTAEEIAEIEKLSTFYTVTNMSNDADCGMKVKYIADAKSYVDNRIALIEQAMLNNI